MNLAERDDNPVETTRARETKAWKERDSLAAAMAERANLSPVEETVRERADTANASVERDDAAAVERDDADAVANASVDAADAADAADAVVDAADAANAVVNAVVDAADAADAADALVDADANSAAAVVVGERAAADGVVDERDDDVVKETEDDDNVVVETVAERDDADADKVERANTTAEGIDALLGAAALLQQEDGRGGGGSEQVALPRSPVPPELLEGYQGRPFPGTVLNTKCTEFSLTAFSSLPN